MREARNEVIARTLPEGGIAPLAAAHQDTVWSSSKSGSGWAREWNSAIGSTPSSSGDGALRFSFEARPGDEFPRFQATFPRQSGMFRVQGMGGIPSEGPVHLLRRFRTGGQLPTVRSRCQLLTLKPPPETQAVAWREAQGVQGDLRLALPLSGRVPLAARALLESDLVQRRAAALDRFLELGHGSGDPVALAAAWMQWDLPLLLDRI
jgi:hypothetical protein